MQNFIKNKEYTTEIREVSEEDKIRAPALYKDLEDNLYQITYKTSNNDLLVILNNNKVLKVIPISYVSIEGGESKNYKIS